MGSLRQTPNSLLALIENRISLLAADIESEKARILSLLLTGLFALFFLGLGILSAVVAIALVFWGTHREWVMGGLSLFFLVVGVLLLWALRRQRKRSSPPFSATLAELRKDRDRLNSDD